MKVNVHTVARRSSFQAANDNGRLGAGQPPISAHARDYLILLAVIAGVALFYWLTISFLEWDRIMTCVTMGKRTCVPPIELHHP